MNPSSSFKNIEHDLVSTNRKLSLMYRILFQIIKKLKSGYMETVPFQLQLGAVFLIAILFNKTSETVQKCFPDLFMNF